MRLGVARALVDGTVVAGDVDIVDDRVVAVGVPRSTGTGTAVPGLVDLQVNGFAGVDFLAADVGGYREAGRALAATGVTAFQPTFVSAAPATHRSALRVAAAAREDPWGPRVLGVHLEGPFLSPRWAGAHDPAHIVEPDLSLASELLDAGPVTYMTLAPELPGALALIRHLVAAGVVVAAGHSDADAAAATAGFDAGVRAVTHVHNAHRRWAPRAPGLAGAALTRPDVVVQAIVDHVHLAPETVSALEHATRGRFGLVTDAVEAAGRPEGRYRLGGRDVVVAGGAVRLADGTLAGSVLTLDTAVRNLVALGVPLGAAVGAATAVPARLVGRCDLGVLRPGGRADVAVLDDDLAVARTLVDGRERHAA